MRLPKNRTHANLKSIASDFKYAGVLRKTRAKVAMRVFRPVEGRPWQGR